MGDLDQALMLIEEGQAAWEAGRLDDAITLLTAATEVAPDLPDPWIDLAGVLREKGDHASLERALDADRQVVALGESVESLLPDVVQARGRLDRAAAQALEQEQRQVVVRAEAVRREQIRQARHHAYDEAHSAAVGAYGEFQEEIRRYQDVGTKWNALTRSSAPSWERLAEWRASSGDDALWQEALAASRERITRRREAQLVAVWNELYIAATKVAQKRAASEKAQQLADHAQTMLNSPDPPAGWVPPAPPAPSPTPPRPPPPPPPTSGGR